MIKKFYRSWNKELEEEGDRDCCWCTLLDPPPHHFTRLLLRARLPPELPKFLLWGMHLVHGACERESVAYVASARAALNASEAPTALRHLLGYYCLNPLRHRHGGFRLRFLYLGSAVRLGRPSLRCSRLGHKAWIS